MLITVKADYYYCEHKWVTITIKNVTIDLGLLSPDERGRLALGLTEGARVLERNPIVETEANNG